MTIFQALFLGILQGLTEFLPVSSSGHLVLAETFFQLQIAPAALQGFDITLHAGTLVALLLCYPKLWGRILRSPFRDDREHRRLLFLLIVATIPAVLAGLFLQDIITETLRSLPIVAGALLFTAFVLLWGERFRGSSALSTLKIPHVILIGCAQALALVPGLSRSGMTISAGRAMHLSRKEALDFSFLMAVPVIAGATVLTIYDVMRGTVSLPGATLVLAGFFSSVIVSVLAVLFLRKWVITRSLGWFALYLVPTALFILFSLTKNL